MRTLLALIVLMPLMDGLYTPDHFWYAQKHEVRQPRVILVEEVKEEPVRQTDEQQQTRPLERTEPIHITCGIDQNIDCTSRGGGR